MPCTQGWQTGSSNCTRHTATATSRRLPWASLTVCGEVGGLAVHMLPYARAQALSHRPTRVGSFAVVFQMFDVGRLLRDMETKAFGVLEGLFDE